MIRFALRILLLLPLAWPLAAPANSNLQLGSGLRPTEGTGLDAQALLRMAEQGDDRAAFLLGMRFASGAGRHGKFE